MSARGVGLDDILFVQRLRGYYAVQLIKYSWPFWVSIHIGIGLFEQQSWAFGQRNHWRHDWCDHWRGHDHRRQVQHCRYVQFGREIKHRRYDDFWRRIKYRGNDDKRRDVEHWWHDDDGWHDVNWRHDGDRWDIGHGWHDHNRWNVERSRHVKHGRYEWRDQLQVTHRKYVNQFLTSYPIGARCLRRH